MDLAGREPGEGGADMDAAQVAERLRRIKEEGINWSSLTEAVLGRPALCVSSSRFEQNVH